MTICYFFQYYDFLSHKAFPMQDYDLDQLLINFLPNWYLFLILVDKITIYFYFSKTTLVTNLSFLANLIGRKHLKL